MASYYISRLVFAFLLQIMKVSGRVYYDTASCQPYTYMLNEAIPAAMEMAEFASAAIGGPVANDPNDNIWAFPDPESRDLAGRIFGPVRTTLSSEWPNNYQYIKNGFDYILNNYAVRDPSGNFMNPNPATPGVTVLGSEDVLIFCDLKRLEQQPDGSYRNGDPNLPMSNDRMPQEDYNMCYNYLLSTITALYYGSPVAALTESLTHAVPVIVDPLAPLFTSATAKIIDVSKAEHGLDIDPYGWKNVEKLASPAANGGAPQLAYKNADSWTYFGIGAQQLTQGNRINRDGSMSDIGWTVNLDGSVANYLLVSLTDWTPARKLRNRDSASSKPEAFRELPRGRFNKKVLRTPADLSKTPLTMANNATHINNSSIYGATLQLEEIGGPKVTSYSSASASAGLASFTPLSLSWNNSSSSTFLPKTVSNKPYLLSSWYPNTTSFDGSHVLPTSSMFLSSSISRATVTQVLPNNRSETTVSSFNFQTQPASTIASFFTTKSPSISAIMISPDAFDNSTSTNATSAIISIGNSFMPTSGYFSDFTTTYTKSGGFITVIKSSTIVISAYSSPSPSSCTATDEVDKVWCQVSTTPKPTATFNLPKSWGGYHPSSTENILSIFTASALYIPSITDLKVFPTLMVKNPNPKGNDDIEIPFVKVTIPNGPCEPLPKVHHGGLFGALFNLGSDIVDGVLDDACHLVFPIVKGIESPLPEWLALNIYPPQESFPDSHEEEKSSIKSTSSKTTSFSSSKLSSSTTTSLSSSTSCSASAVPYCTKSCAVSGSVTQSCISVCLTVSQCSGIATTTSLTSSICNASAISSCLASCAVSAGSTQSCSTVCSTATACSGTATTSSTVSSIDTSENGSWEIHQVPTNFINIQSSIQSVLAAAWASAPKSFDTSSYASVQSSISLAQHISSTSAAGSQGPNISIQSTRHSSLSRVIPTLASSTSLLSNSSTSTSLFLGISTSSGVSYSGISPTATVSFTFVSSIYLSGKGLLSTKSSNLQPSTLSENATLSPGAAKITKSAFDNTKNFSSSSTSSRSTFTSESESAFNFSVISERSSTFETLSLISSLSSHTAVTTSSSQSNTSPIPSVSNTLSKSSVFSSTGQFDVSRSGNSDKPSSYIVLSSPSTFSAAPVRSSTITVPSSHVASTTTPAIEATTPINMFQMNFWHQTDKNKKPTGNLWYIGLVSAQDQNITSHDPLPNPILYPKGSFALPPKGAGAGCYYKGDRSAVGDIFCPGKPTVSCQGNAGEAPVICDGNTSIYPMVLCGLEN